MNRDEFTETTKSIMAKRVGYLCSNPTCRKLTVGKNQDKEKATSIGVAAHITAASVGGPRYDNSLISAKRKHIDNGIWLCQSCSVLIDRDTEKYTVSVLKDWRSQAENYTQQQLQGIQVTKSPYLEVDLIWSHAGRKNDGLSTKNLEKEQPIPVGTPLYMHWILKWNFCFVIHNNSEVPAYNVSLMEKGLKKFTYLEKIAKINNIPPFQSITLDAKYEVYFHGTNKEADKLLEKKFPKDLEKSEVEIKYLDEERNEHITSFTISNDNIKNTKLQ